MRNPRPAARRPALGALLLVVAVLAMHGLGAGCAMGASAGAMGSMSSMSSSRSTASTASMTSSTGSGRTRTAGAPARVVDAGGTATAAAAPPTSGDPPAGSSGGSSSHCVAVAPLPRTAGGHAAAGAVVLGAGLLHAHRRPSDERSGRSPPHAPTRAPLTLLGVLRT